MTNWYENDEFWQDLAPFFFDEERLQATIKEVEDIISLLKLNSGFRILDMCCGVGRHTLEFARRGYSVTGVDRTEFYLKQVKKHAGQLNLNIELVQEDMRRYIRHDTFDAALLMFSSLGYFVNPDDDRKVLTNIYQSLKNNGVLIIDQMGREIVQRKFQPRDWHERKGSFWLEERTVDVQWKFIRNRWILLKENQVKEYSFSLRLYSEDDLKNMLNAVGFNTIRIYGNLSGKPYDDAATRLIVIAGK